MSTGNNSDKTVQGNLRVGFVLEISSIHEYLDDLMDYETLVDLVDRSLFESGYGEIWRSPGGVDALLLEQDFTTRLWVDPTSVISYLASLSGYNIGDVLYLSFSSQPEPLQLDATSWETVRRNLKTSLSRDFLLPDHSVNFDSSGQSFFVEEIVIDGIPKLTLERLGAAVSGIEKFKESSSSAKQFLELFGPEFSSLKSLPEFVVGHIWAQLLSGCDWKSASKILTSDGPIDIDSDSFTWESQPREFFHYRGGWAVEWYRDIRRRLTFNPWPRQLESNDEYFDQDLAAYFRSQVDHMLSGRTPSPQDKIASFASLYLLIDHEDNEDDDAPFTTDQMRVLIHSYLTDSLKVFIETNRSLIHECFTALNKTASDDGYDHYTEFLPEWVDSEGVLAGVPPAYSASKDKERQFDFEPSMVEAVEKLWPEFVAVSSQQQV